MGKASFTKQPKTYRDVTKKKKHELNKKENYSNKVKRVAYTRKQKYTTSKLEGDVDRVLESLED